MINLDCLQKIIYCIRFLGIQLENFSKKKKKEERKKKKIYYVFDSSIFLSKRVSRFLPTANYKCLSYNKPFVIFKNLLEAILKSKFGLWDLKFIVCGFRLPDIFILKFAYLLSIKSIYIQHGIFLTHLKRSSIIKNKKFISYFIFLIALFTLGESPLKLINLYKSGDRGQFPRPSFALVYNEYWEKFHTNLLGWEKTNYIHLGVFDLSRNSLSINGIIK